MMRDFSDIDNWIFDLDNTLYPAGCDLFSLIDIKMGGFIERLLECDAAQARKVQKDFFYEYGTTLSGLMRHHDVDPHEFLDYVHDISMDRLVAAPELARQITTLPGRKLVFTNGDAAYARKVLEKRGLSGVFETIYDIHDCAYAPKPLPAAYDGFLEKTGVNPKRSLFVEDMARNLEPAKALGMTTIWVNNGSEMGNSGHKQDYIDYEIADLEQWMTSLMG